MTFWMTTIGVPYWRTSRTKYLTIRSFRSLSLGNVFISAKTSWRIQRHWLANSLEATRRVATLETGGRTEGKDNDMGIRKSKSCSSTVSVVGLYLTYAVVVLSKISMKYDALMMSRLRWSLVSTRRSPRSDVEKFEKFKKSVQEVR